MVLINYSLVNLFFSACYLNAWICCLCLCYNNAYKVGLIRKITEKQEATDINSDNTSLYTFCDIVSVAPDSSCDPECEFPH